LRSLFHLGLRQTEGFVGSLMRLMRLEHNPSYRTYTPSITVSGYITNTNYQEYVRYVMHYADGTSYYSESYLASTNSWQTLAADNIPVHAGMRGTVISIDVQVRKTSSASYGAYGRVEVSGFETTP